ncbi:uncharacterized protein BDZ99DRAFT_524782 [Mytilinidion resinicola]|uniref:Uncharacterized protein n=1 Tax=Mytilinidion resinicola TaxID=574789 RepID=A0A6A6Y927_9PEZI|nr:uncharacterized protein BDZ99DRAFT_524782 [Mytilinidion resinicola]KAF2805058.1 hypothetical protein BDZ99DRAFT_524782 [Mytilinidion resinicola]
MASFFVPNVMVGNDDCITQITIELSHSKALSTDAFSFQSSSSTIRGGPRILLARKDGHLNCIQNSRAALGNGAHAPPRVHSTFDSGNAMTLIDKAFLSPQDLKAQVLPIVIATYNPPLFALLVCSRRTHSEATFLEDINVDINRSISSLVTNGLTDLCANCGFPRRLSI